MASEQQTPALAGTGVREATDLAAKRVDREHTDAGDWSQDRLVTARRKNGSSGTGMAASRRRTTATSTCDPLRSATATSRAPTANR